MHWERLVEQPLFVLRRSGRYLVADLLEPHAVLSTSIRNGGQVSHVRYLVNHQSCEGAAHVARHDVITGAGQSPYHDVVCGGGGSAADATAMMGTAANMNYAAVVQETDERLTVAAIVTAGVEGNATAAGEPASWRETDAGIHKVPVYDGTINTMVLDQPAADAGRAGPQRRHHDRRQVSGAAASRGPEHTPRRSRDRDRHRPVLHRRAGCRRLGADLRQPAHEAGRAHWQRGAARDDGGAAVAERSRSRATRAACFTRWGATGSRKRRCSRRLLRSWPRPIWSCCDGTRKRCSSSRWSAPRHTRSRRSATVCATARIPDSCAGDAMVQQAANLAANLAAQVHRWPEFRMRLQPHASGDVKTLVLHALALGWSEKWRTSH